MQELRRRALELTVRALEPDQTTCPCGLCPSLDLVHLLARERDAAGNANASHASTLRDRGTRNAELRVTEHVAGIEELQSIAEVGPIGAISLHRVGVCHP